VSGHILMVPVLPCAPAFLSKPAPSPCGFYHHGAASRLWRLAPSIRDSWARRSAVWNSSADGYSKLSLPHRQTALGVASWRFVDRLWATRGYAHRVVGLSSTALLGSRLR
jgi:hypothetical protein